MWRIIIYFFFFSCSRSEHTTDMIINFVHDTLAELEKVFESTDYTRQKSIRTPAFEIGFVMRNMEECYRRMVDIYHSSLNTDLYNLDAKPSDHIMFLKHIEILFWVIDHLTNMLHEVEKKYKVKGDNNNLHLIIIISVERRPLLDIEASPKECQIDPAPPTSSGLLSVAGMFAKHRVWTVPTPPSSRVTKFQSKAIIKMPTTTTRQKQQWWPLDYGWEMNYRW